MGIAIAYVVAMPPLWFYLPNFLPMVAGTIAAGLHIIKRTLEGRRTEKEEDCEERVVLASSYVEDLQKYMAPSTSGSPGNTDGEEMKHF